MRIFMNIIGLLLISAGLCFPARAESLDAFRAAARSITSIQADFVQEKHMAILAHPLTASGRFVYQAPASLRWEYTRPFRSLLLMHNGKVRRFTQAADGKLKEDTGAAQYMEVAMGEISKLMTGRFDESKMFSAKLLPDENKIVLTPREASFRNFITRIVLVMADKPGVIEEVVIYESKDSFTRFRFTHTVLNAPLSDKLFRVAK